MAEVAPTTCRSQGDAADSSRRECSQYVAPSETSDEDAHALYSALNRGALRTRQRHQTVLSFGWQRQYCISETRQADAVLCILCARISSIGDVHAEWITLQCSSHYGNDYPADYQPQPWGTPGHASAACGLRGNPMVGGTRPCRCPVANQISWREACRRHTRAARYGSAADHMLAIDPRVRRER